MDRPTPNFTMTDLLQQIQEEIPEFADGEALTTAEIAEALGLSENATRRRLRELKRAGQIRVVSKRVQAINNRFITTTAWAIQQSHQEA